MHLRTRVAFVVVTLLVGWILASAHRTGPKPSESTSSRPTPPTLEIQRPPTTTSSQNRTDVPTHRWPQPAAPPFGHSAAPVSAAPASTGPSLPPQRLPGSTEREAGAGPLKPVRLLGVDFGRDSTGRTTALRASESITNPRPGRSSPISIDAAPGARRALKPDSSSRPPAARTWHRIVNGDNLPDLAETYLGDRTAAMLLYAVNKEVLVSPEILPIGAEIRIPSRLPRAASPTSPVPAPQDSRNNLLPGVQPAPPPAHLQPRDSGGWRVPQPAPLSSGSQQES